MQNAALKQQATEKRRAAPLAYFETLGTLRVTIGNSPRPVKSRKSRALLAYLALSPQKSESRVRIAGLLWSEKTDKESRVSLRQQLRGLKHDLGTRGAEVLGSDRLNVWLAGDLIASDIGDLLAALGSGEIPELLIERKSVTDDFLRDLDDLDPAFDYWLAVQRESYRDQLVRKLSAMVVAVAANSEQSHRIALAIRNLDPTSEEACRILMQYHAARGDVTAALRIYSELWTLLDGEFDMEPAEETQVLVARIKLGGRAVGLAEDPAPSGWSSPSLESGNILILVEPFQNEGLEEAHMRRVVGLRHELIAALTRFRDWSVREAGAHIDEQALAGRKAYLLSATAFEENDQVLVSLMLSRQADRTYLWSQRVSIQLTEWLATKLHIIRKIATSLEVQLSAERLARTAKLPDQNLDVYDRWLRGNGLIYLWQPKAEIRAEGIFRSILADTQDFAPAFVGLVQILNTRHHIFPGVMRDRQREDEALELAKAAVRLDPMDSRTQLCLAWSHILKSHFSQAAFYYDMALQMNENDPWTLTSCALGLAYCNDKKRARQIADHALEVAIGGAPIHWSYQMCLRFLDHDYAGAVTAAEHAEGSAFFVPAWKAAALAQMNEYEAARWSIQEFYSSAARNWSGRSPVSPQNVLDWFCQCFPISVEADRDRLRDGVMAAGLLQLGKE